MTQTKVEVELKSQQMSFDRVAQLPNTLERNLVLAEHRAEIARLTKLIARVEVPSSK